MKVDNWNVSFIIEGEMAGVISDDDFINYVEKDRVYDSAHFVIELSREEIKKIINKSKAE